MPKPSIRAALAAAALSACILAPGALAAKPIGAFTTKHAWTFYSAPRLHPPKLTTDARTAYGKLAPGYLFLANFKSLGVSAPLAGQSGPLIVDSHLQPVWFAPVPTASLAANLAVQSYNGQPALSWWQGVISGLGVVVSGEDVVVGQNYRTIATLKGQGGWIISPHEMVIAGHDAWVTAYKTVTANLTSVGGSATGLLLDSAVQEYDLQTGALLNTWDALAHIPLTQSKNRPGAAKTPWDAYHVNSIQLMPDGKLLVSIRNTWGVYLIDPTSGSIVWTLGGSASTFSFGPNAAFSWQHDAELSSDATTLTLFDDACCGQNGNTFTPANGPARGLVLRLDVTAHTATLVAQYLRGKKFIVGFLGSMQQLPNGNALVGWGTRPYLSELSPSGKVLLDVVLPGPDVSYRARVETWVGTPANPPSGAVRTVGGKTVVYASWDGATQVAKWHVLAGASGSHLRAVATVRRSGFETALTLSKHYRRYKVQALDIAGHVLGTSAVLRG